MPELSRNGSGSILELVSERLSPDPDQTILCPATFCSKIWNQRAKRYEYVKVSFLDWQWRFSFWKFLSCNVRPRVVNLGLDPYPVPLHALSCWVAKTSSGHQSRASFECPCSCPGFPKELGSGKRWWEQIADRFLDWFKAIHMCKLIKRDPENWVRQL